MNKETFTDEELKTFQHKMFETPIEWGRELPHTDLPMDRTWCEEVIISTVKRRGKGVEGDPIRIVTQVFLKDGTLIAEYDPPVNISYPSQWKTKPMKDGDLISPTQTINRK